MKISQIKIADLKGYANVFHNEDDELFTHILTASKAYIKGYTGLSEDSLDDNEDLAIVLYVLANEMYDNRAYNIESAKANLLVQSMLQMHSINLL